MTEEDLAALIRRCEVASFPTIGHFLEEGFVDPGLHAMTPNVKVVGRAATARVVGADAITVNDAVARITPGDVLVIDMGGDHAHACLGAVTGTAVQAAGARGVVVDGAVTDIVELRAMGLPVFARGTSILTTKRHGAGLGGCNLPVVCGGVVVRPGDLVLADDNGVLFLDPAVAAGVIDRALASDAAEPAILARLRAGERAATVFGA